MTPPQWSAERVVEPELAASLLETQFPELGPIVLEPLGEGWDNTAYLVNNLMVFRFPRRQIAVPLIEIEARVLPRIASKLPLPVPRPIWVGRPSREYPWPFSGYPLIAGCTADVADLDDRGRGNLARPLGEFLRVLHALPSEGLAGDSIGRLDAKRLIGRIRGLIEAPDAALRGVLDTSAELRPSGRRAIVHGDLYARHLLLEEDDSLSGIIDWGDLHEGDPAVDLAVAWSFLPPAARGVFRASYGPIDDGTWRLARLRALHYGALLIDYARGVGDGRLVREGQTILRLVAVE
jgi:aminoglycoside phosphotransferase (APT) family kinase protein